jgi:carboxyl-terminal processing protease
MRVHREAALEPLTLTMRREPIHLVSVRGIGYTADGKADYFVDPVRRIAYLRISSFHEGTGEEFAQALDAMTAAGAQALVIDLRFNPGGIMQQAVAVVDQFVDGGVIVSTVTRRHAVSEYRATAAGTRQRLPLVALINGASASAAEIVAGSLQAADRATVVGSRSFGKGSVQHLIHLRSHEAAIKLTTAYYRLPDGRFIHRTASNTSTNAWGVIPDVEVVLDREQEAAVADARHEMDTAGIDPAWQPDPGHHASPTASRRPSDATSARRTLPIDPQLERAVHILAQTLEAASSTR